MTRHWRPISAVILIGAVIACGSDPEAGSDAGVGSDSGIAADSGTAAPVYAAFVRGTLSSTDTAVAQAAHDAIASQNEARSKAAGDFAHDVLLGTTLLDSVEDEFLAIDRWTDAAAMRAFYADPLVQQSFSGLFRGAPRIEFFVAAPDWVSWGDMESGDSFDPYYFHFADGVLAQTDTAQNRTAHNQVAAGGKDPSIAAGNVAHVIYLGLDDQRRFIAVDIWARADNIEAFYQNPMFRMVFLPLFEDVTEPVYRSTTWHQW